MLAGVGALHEVLDDSLLALHADLKADCGVCHKTDAWEPATYDHDKYFRFDRDHPPNCADCHLGADYSSYTCYECHRRGEVREEHLDEGIRDYEVCVDCHRSGDEDEAKRKWRLKRGRSRDRSRRDRDDD